MARRDKIHEIRDPIHVFVKLNSAERDVLDSRPLQRLRHIHQLSLTHLVYPGATHKRFEHSIGVMEVATRIFDVVTAARNVRKESVKRFIPGRKLKTSERGIRYWRQVLRIAALCHDVGHLPFSHTAEAKLLPEGWDHERLTANIILSEEMRHHWTQLGVDPKHVVKIALGPKYQKYYPHEHLDIWEAVVSEMVTSDAFGADRIDYLLRDSHHAGVAYGRFDHYRLIDTLRILPKGEDATATEPQLGVERGGLNSAEALLLARYFMFRQLYFHHVRRIYDIHLVEFLESFLPDGRFPTVVADHLSMNDDKVSLAIADAAADATNNAHELAVRIVHRKHFRRIYERNPRDFGKNEDAARLVYEKACEQYGSHCVRYDPVTEKESVIDFPVLFDDGRLDSASRESMVIPAMKPIATEYVFVSPECRVDADRLVKRVIKRNLG